MQVYETKFFDPSDEHHYCELITELGKFKGEAHCNANDEVDPFDGRVIALTRAKIKASGAEIRLEKNSIATLADQIDMLIEERDRRIATYKYHVNQYNTYVEKLETYTGQDYSRAIKDPNRF